MVRPYDGDYDDEYAAEISRERLEEERYEAHELARAERKEDTAEDDLLELPF